MKFTYRLDKVSNREEEFHQRILLQEVDMQSWYAIVYCELMVQEVFLSIQ
jgi:hypothetical protein